LSIEAHSPLSVAITAELTLGLSFWPKLSFFYRLSSQQLFAVYSAKKSRLGCRYTADLAFQLVLGRNTKITDAKSMPKLPTFIKNL
jgi:hypothetical protein